MTDGKPTGRPSAFTPSLAERICAELVEGKSVREICVADDMPGCSTVYRWLQSNETFREQYVRAREVQAERLAEEIIEIADDGTNDWMERQRKDGSTETVVDQENINRSRLRVDARKWVASKLLPKKYGDRVTTELTGKDGGPVEMREISPTEVARRLAFLLTSGTESVITKH